LAYIFFSSSPIIANFSPFFLPMPPRRSQRKGAISAETIADSSSEEFVAVVSDEPYVFFFLGDHEKFSDSLVYSVQP